MMFELELDKVEEYISKSMDYKVKKRVIYAVMSYLHRISSYREEDKTFSFKIALGYSKNEQMEAPCFFPIKKIILADESSEILEERQKAIWKNETNLRKAIHDVAVFCEKGSDLYIYQKDFESYTEIECGTYFTELEITGVLERRILEHGGMIFESKDDSLISLRSYNKDGYPIQESVNFSLKRIETPVHPVSHRSPECCYWDGLFRIVKSSVHGTICLIVSPEWNGEEKGVFTKKPELLDRIDISYEQEYSYQKKKRIDMFLSMLDYDGITILGTDGRVKSYHNFCRNEDGDELVGGARHRAYNFLTKQQNPFYVGVYFQSHEGDVKYFDFKDGNDDKKFFDSTKMTYGIDNPQTKIVQNYLLNNKTRLDRNEQLFYKNQNQLEKDFFLKISELRNAHFGGNNFYNEEKPAKELSAMYKANKPQLDISFGNYPFLAAKFIDVLIHCFIGNEYGYSFAARGAINDTMSEVPYSVYRHYFNEKHYINLELLRAIDYNENEWRDASQIIARTVVDDDEEENKRLDFLGEIYGICAESSDMRSALVYFDRNPSFLGLKEQPLKP